MTEYLNVAVFATGIGTGIVLTIYAIKFGFKLSAEIRRFKGDEDVESTLFKPNSDPGEFEIIKDDEDEDE